MSSEEDQSVSREVAVRAFAGEFEMANHTYKESDDQRAPLYMLLPSGTKANRLLIVGTLTETEEVSEGNWRGRIADPTGAFNVYAGDYEPEPANVLRQTDPPNFVAVVGKPRTFETDDGNIRSTLRPESITVLDSFGEEEAAEANRVRWVQETARQTMERLREDPEEHESEDVQTLLRDQAHVRAAELHYEDVFDAGERRTMSDLVVQALESLDR